MIDAAGPDPGAAHDTVHTWRLRNRLQRAQGHHGNDVIWWGPEPLVGDLNWTAEGLTDMDKWLTAVENDHSSKSRAEKIVADPPAQVHDRCKFLNEFEGVPTKKPARRRPRRRAMARRAPPPMKKAKLGTSTSAGCSRSRVTTTRRR
jgi:hypothetical protein